MVLMLIVLGFILLAIGWLLGMDYQRRQKEEPKFSVPPSYLKGLNFLLNEEPDKAVDVFIKMLEVDSETVETHLALGKLFRKRGEIDRAIRIHQNLIARPSLTGPHRIQALLELGQDYLSAGVLDRAERVFQEVIVMDKTSKVALKSLLDIYQQEKEWLAAVKVAEQLSSQARNDMKNVMAHHYCELAEQGLRHENRDQFNDYLKRALNRDKKSFRANLLQAKFYIRQGDYKAAQRSLCQIRELEPDFASEVLELAVLCYERVEDYEGLINYLQQCVSEDPYSPAFLILTEKLLQSYGEEQAVAFVLAHIRKHPSLVGLNLLIKLHLKTVDGVIKEELQVANTLTERLVAKEPRYRCQDCGFQSNILHWQCPGCKHWGVIKPNYVIERKEKAAY